MASREEFDLIQKARFSVKNNKSSTKDIKKCYLLGLLLTVSIGTIQFGYSIGSWNTATDAYA